MTRIGTYIGILLIIVACASGRVCTTPACTHLATARLVYAHSAVDNYNGSVIVANAYARRGAFDATTAYITTTLTLAEKDALLIQLEAIALTANPMIMTCTASTWQDNVSTAMLVLCMCASVLYCISGVIIMGCMAKQHQKYE